MRIGNRTWQKRLVSLLLLALSGCGDPSEIPWEWQCPETAACPQKYCEQVLIPSGEFLMGHDAYEKPLKSFISSVDPRPPHRVKLSPFCMDKYEVTGERYLACVAAKVCDGEGHQWKGKGSSQPAVGGVRVNHYPAQCQSDVRLCPQYPVNCKSHAQAVAYCAWIGRRLCTEAEWERAAAGPNPKPRRYPWGDTFAKDKLNIGSTLVPVDSHPLGASAEGVFNLSGNVYEWTADVAAAYSTSSDGQPLVNPTGPAQGPDRIIRGGCPFVKHTYTTHERSKADAEFDWG